MTKHTIRRWIPSGQGAVLMTVTLDNSEEGETLTLETGEVITVCAEDLKEAKENE